MRTGTGTVYTIARINESHSTVLKTLANDKPYTQLKKTLFYSIPINLVSKYSGKVSVAPGVL